MPKCCAVLADDFRVEHDRTIVILDRSRIHAFPSSRSTNREILEPGVGYRVRVVQIATVEQKGLFEALLDAEEVRATEFFPLGDDQERIAPFERSHRCVGKLDPRLAGENTP